MTTPRHRRTLGMGIVLVALVLSACTDAPDVIVPSDGPPSVASNIASVASATEAARTANEELQAVAAGRVENLDDRMLRLEVEVPGFGGFYYDSASQALAVYVRDEARGSRAAEAVRRVARSAAALASVADAPIQVRPANHAFSELVSWKKLLIGPLARLSNFLSIDADESRNRVVIEVADVAAQVEVERALSAAGIPESVFLVRPGVAFQSLQSNLTSYVRPTGGGSQISYYVGFQTGLCTLGWNTPALPSGERGFLTAGHCNESGIGGPTGQTIYQAVPSSQVGTILLNPAWTVPSCWYPGLIGNYAHPCTQADVLFVRYPSPDSGYKRVAYTTAPQLNNNQPGTTSFGGWWTAIDMNGFSAVGLSADKVGRTTGWTRGTHDATCIDIRVNAGSSDEYMVLCAHRVVNGSVGQGDSGGPVFQYPGPHISFLGVLFAGAPLNVGPDGGRYCDEPSGSACQFLYSDYDQIRNHLVRNFTPNTQ